MAVINSTSPANHLLIVVPANNEALSISDCLEHLLTSREQLPIALMMRTHIIIVCDACTDDTAMIAKDMLCPLRDRVVSCEFANVGQARAFGAKAAWQLLPGKSAQAKAVWYAFTDADTNVPADWLLRHALHLTRGAHAALGVVQIDHDDVSIGHGFAVKYKTKIQDNYHQHIHGANMGVRGDYYWSVGGFPSLVAHEDRQLVNNLCLIGARVECDSNLMVTTSHRRHGRTPSGFARDLRELEQAILDSTC